MKKAILFSSLLLLNGCFMYHNFDCALRGTCEDVEKIEQQKINSVIDAISDRCTKDRGLKVGTIEYMDCNEDLKAMFNNLASYYDIDEATGKFLFSLSMQETVCEGYGMKKGTKNFSQCLAKLETKDASAASRQIALEKERQRAGIEALAQGMNDAANNIRPTPTIRCSTRTIGRTSYTDCH